MFITLKADSADDQQETSRFTLDSGNFAQI
jgi:hypothetical protein